MSGECEPERTTASGPAGRDAPVRGGATGTGPRRIRVPHPRTSQAGVPPHDVGLHSVTECDLSAQLPAAEGWRGRLGKRLTDRHWEALRTAVGGGYYPGPERTTETDIGEAMDVGQETVS
jgi:hypothetical protein